MEYNLAFLLASQDILHLAPSESANAIPKVLHQTTNSQDQGEETTITTNSSILWSSSSMILNFSDI